MITLRDVHKTFNAGRENEVQALRGVSLTIERGSVTALEGPSGSGKSTLMTIVGSMSRPTSGRVFYRETETTSLPERFLAKLRRERFGFVFQRLNLIFGLSAIENVMIPAYPTGRPHAEIREAAHALLSRFGIADKAAHRVATLSGGQAQRVAIARALINSPEVLIADEPTAHLDTRLSAELMDLLGELAAEGRTLILTSHDPKVYGSKIVGSVVSVRDGRVAAP